MKLNPQPGQIVIDEIGDYYKVIFLGVMEAYTHHWINCVIYRPLNKDMSDTPGSYCCHSQERFVERFTEYR